MSLDPATFAPAEAWLPLKPEEWNQDTARHLLHRIGFSATPDRVAAAQKQGLQATLVAAFDTIRLMPMPQVVADYRTKSQELVQAMRAQAQVTDQPSDATALAQKRSSLQMEINQLERQSNLQYVQDWLTFARQPENSAQENLVMFLGNVFVVASSKVRQPDRLFAYNHLLRSFWQRSLPDLTKSITFSPAMIQYLDLDSSSVGVPNENYARELMELFTLGEGHYTENDIKEAARALTGLTIVNEQGTFARRRWDPGAKTIYGQTGNWSANDVVDLIFRQPAAQTHFPRRFLAYYLTQDPLPAPYMDALGKDWVQNGWSIQYLVHTVFSSKLFYRPEFRRALIKSPIQYYLGLCQDLNLDVSPLEGEVAQLIRSMGQEVFNPPNVRGWLGGKNWINSSTLAARRQVVQSLFNPRNETNFTADQKNKLAEARAQGRGVIGMTQDRLDALAKKSDEEVADSLLNYFLSGNVNDAYRRNIIDYMQNDMAPRTELVRDVATALFQAPEYHLC